MNALFRGGKKHGNAGQAAGDRVEDVVRSIRTHYRADVPILFRDRTADPPVFTWA